MKYPATALLAGLLVAWPAAAQSVEVLELRPSGEKPVITVLKDGTPKQGAILAVFTQGGKQKLTLVTDSHGRATLPHLAPGTYCISASTAPTLRADLCLQIARGRRRNPSTFNMQLLVKPPPPPTFAERLAAAESAPVRVSTGTFSGIVVDPAGTAIPRVSIAIHRQGSGFSAHPRKIRSDQNGHFSRNLSAGRYTAVFSAQGFETQFLPFEIVRGATEKAINVKLNLGAVTESVTVAARTEDH